MSPRCVAQQHGRLRRRSWLRQRARPDMVETEEDSSDLAVALAEGVVMHSRCHGLVKPGGFGALSWGWYVEAPSGAVVGGRR